MEQRSVILKELIAKRTTELEESNTLLTQNHNILNRLLASRERLFRAVAHELRTPLTVIISSTESLQSENKVQNNLISMVLNRAQKMGSLIDHLLEISNNAPREVINKESFPPIPAISEALASFKEIAEQQEKVLKQSSEPLVEDAYLSMSRITFVMMISNLVANALKFTERKGSIDIYCSRRDNLIEIIIDDDGIGVDENVESRIFNWFECGHSKNETMGWGIGLAFVKDEAEAAGGQIELCKNGKPGATFKLTLPCDRGTEAKTFRNTPRLAVSSDEEEHLPLWNLERKYTILVIEDDEDLLQQISNLFPKHWKKLIVPDAETGVELAYNNEPDIIITDLLLPGESGFDLTKKLKNDPQTAHIPIIILTALKSEENRLTGLGLSADSFLGKPFSNKELQLRVGGLLVNRDNVLHRAKQFILHNPDQITTHSIKEGQSFEREFFEKLNSVLGEDKDFNSLSLNEAAKKLAMSSRSLQREMEKVGISWREYKRFRRMRIAMDLLRGTDKSVGSIAELTGYSSAAHFSKTFKDMTGKTPSEWRKNIG